LCLKGYERIGIEPDRRNDTYTGAAKPLGDLSLRSLPMKDKARDLSGELLGVEVIGA
jgi:hypothetical protein